MIDPKVSVVSGKAMVNNNLHIYSQKETFVLQLLERKY